MKRIVYSDKIIMLNTLKFGQFTGCRVEWIKQKLRSL